MLHFSLIDGANYVLLLSDRWGKITKFFRFVYQQLIVDVISVARLRDFPRLCWATLNLV